MERYVRDQGCEWLFNPPHTSHFGGAWERQIGTIHRVLDTMLAQLRSSQLTHELLVTLMAEVTAIVNARPIAAMPTDTDEPQPLSHSMLLTMKTRPLGPPLANFVPVNLYGRPPPLEMHPVSRRSLLNKVETRALADHADQDQVEGSEAKPEPWRCGPHERRGGAL